MQKMIRKAGLALALAAAVGGCDSGPETPLAPQAASLKSSKPDAAGALRFAITSKGSKVGFAMEAPKEKIRGRVADAISGEVVIDPKDVTKTTAHLVVDLSGLEIYQRVADDKGGFEGEKKNEMQNTHARAWLEIGEDAPAEARKKNSRVEFLITKVDSEQRDLSKLSGADRKLSFTVTGDFLLHGRKSKKTAKLKGSMHFDGDKPTKLHIESVEPFAVGLAEHDVKPREAFGKLAQKTLDMLAPKVAKEALVSVSFDADMSGVVEAGAAPEGK